MKALQILKVLNEKLKNIDGSVESSEMEAMVKVVSALKKLETTEDVLSISDMKTAEISNATSQKKKDLEIAENANRADLFLAKNNSLDAVSTEAEKISQVPDQNETILNNIVDNFFALNDVPNGSTICSEISNNYSWKYFTKSGNLPFIFGILSRQDDYGATGAGGFTTIFSGPASANATHASGVFSLLTGCHDYKTDYAGFYKSPKLCFLQGEAGNFIWREIYMQYASANTYMREAVGCIFIKNTTDAAIATTLSFGGSGESLATYGGVGAMVGTPDFENDTMTWASVAYTTGTNGTTLSGSITIPANTTVVLLICSTAYYITNQESCYFKFLHWQVNQIRSATLVDGLEIDVEKTLKAWQCPGFSSVFDLFREENE
jgi:hypothetical protein